MARRSKYVPEPDPRLAREVREASAAARRRGRDPEPHLERIAKLADDMRRRR